MRLDGKVEVEWPRLLAWPGAGQLDKAGSLSCCSWIVSGCKMRKRTASRAGASRGKSSRARGERGSQRWMQNNGDTHTHPHTAESTPIVMAHYGGQQRGMQGMAWACRCVWGWPPRPRALTLGAPTGRLLRAGAFCGWLVGCSIVRSRRKAISLFVCLTHAGLIMLTQLSRSLTSKDFERQAHDPFCGCLL